MPNSITAATIPAEFFSRKQASQFLNISEASKAGTDPEAARRSAMKPFTGFRFHDLRHQSITEMAEAGVPEAAMQSIAGHLSKKMLEHYSHVRLAAKRQAVRALGGGLIMPEPDAQQAKGKAN